MSGHPFSGSVQQPFDCHRRLLETALFSGGVGRLKKSRPNSKVKFGLLAGSKTPNHFLPRRLRLKVPAKAVEGGRFQDMRIRHLDNNSGGIAVAVAPGDFIAHRHRVFEAIELQEQIRLVQELHRGNFKDPICPVTSVSAHQPVAGGKSFFGSVQLLASKRYATECQSDKLTNLDHVDVGESVFKLQPNPNGLLQAVQLAKQAAPVSLSAPLTTLVPLSRHAFQRVQLNAIVGTTDFSCRCAGSFMSNCWSTNNPGRRRSGPSAKITWIDFSRISSGSFTDANRTVIGSTIAAALFRGWTKGHRTIIVGKFREWKPTSFWKQRVGG